MKKLFTYLSVLLVLASFVACHKREKPVNGTVLGVITTNLDANESVVRRKECLIGNLLCDAVFKTIADRGNQIDGAVLNGGDIRFDAVNRPNGIYPAGPFTDNMADEMLPFGDNSVIVKVNGKQLKEIFERSVAQYSQLKGPFLQVSSNFKVTIDTTKAAQILNAQSTAIFSSGQRIISIALNGTMIDSTTTTYSIVVPTFIALGNDGYVTLLNIAPALKLTIADIQANALKEELLVEHTITPVLQNRIVFQ
ncbi:MAG TPA: 5'-nucleotidase [Bacteroidia bacterium]|nr:5'-nucleotidase [Bacteroidia bacterium]